MSFNFSFSLNGIIILIVLITSSNCLLSEREKRQSFGTRANNHNNNQCSLNYNFDFILFSLNWPISFCWQKGECNLHDRLKPNKWYIHGLWPQYMDGSWPQYCCANPRFNNRFLTTIKEELLEKWSSLRTDGNHQAFWRHEWNKHGACTQKIPQLSGQLNYFKRTLEIYDSYPIYDWLSGGGIIPSIDKHYSISNIHQSIEANLKKRIRLECAKLPNSVPLLTEIHICLDKHSLEAIDCPIKDDNQCGAKDIILPSH